MSGSKRAREGQVKQEDQAVAEQAQPAAPAAPAAPAKPALKIADITRRADHIRYTIAEFSQAFILHGPNIPVVLHFPITDWAATFRAQLVSQGLDEDAAHSQVGATLTLMLAEWGKHVAATDTARALGVSARQLVEPYVAEAVSIGVFIDKDKIMDRIVRTINNLPFAKAADQQQ